MFPNKTLVIGIYYILYRGSQFHFFLPKYGTSRGSERINVTSALLHDNVESFHTQRRFLVSAWLFCARSHQDHVSYSAVILPSSTMQQHIHKW